MKKITVALLTIILIVAFAAFPVGAAYYTDGNFRVLVPDDLIENEELALEYDMTMTWISEDEKFDFSFSKKYNDENYTYVNYSKGEIQDIYEDYVDGSTQDITLIGGENITVGDFEGVRLDMTINTYGVETGHTVCAFSTKTEVYTLYFYVYDEAYQGYVDRIIDTVYIEGSNYDAEKESNMEYIAYVIAVAVVSGIVSLIKKKAAKKKGKPVGYNPVTDAEGKNIVFNPEIDMNNSVPTTAGETNDPQTSSSGEDGGFAAQEAENERNEREELFR